MCLGDFCVMMGQFLRAASVWVWWPCADRSVDEEIGAGVWFRYLPQCQAGRCLYLNQNLLASCSLRFVGLSVLSAFSPFMRHFCSLFL